MKCHLFHTVYLSAHFVNRFLAFYELLDSFLTFGFFHSVKHHSVPLDSFLFFVVMQQKSMAVKQP